MLTLNDALFDTDKADSRATEAEKLGMLATYLTTHPQSKVALDAGADPRGTEKEGTP